MRELLQSAVALAVQAAVLIEQIYETDFKVQDKADLSPLTEADLVAHNVIAGGLSALSSWPIISEEAALVDWQIRRRWERYWLIDPLDGTKEFVKRNGEFTVNIALIEHGKPILGVVVAPILKRSYFAAQGLGAFRQDWGHAPIPIHVSEHAPAAVWRVVGSRSHQSDEVKALLAFIGNVSLVSMGSSLKFCLVAEGAADLYPRLAPTSEWDTAAAQCVVEQAGGAVLTRELAPLAYNGKESIVNPHFIVCGARDPAWGDFFVQ
jgi:3'(2'), 5'-bisphosphate nucleotidase